MGSPFLGWGWGHRQLRLESEEPCLRVSPGLFLHSHSCGGSGEDKERHPGGCGGDREGGSLALGVLWGSPFPSGVRGFPSKCQLSVPAG